MDAVTLNRAKTQVRADVIRRLANNQGLAAMSQHLRDVRRLAQAVHLD